MLAGSETASGGRGSLFFPKHVGPFDMSDSSRISTVGFGDMEADLKYSQSFEVIAARQSPTQCSCAGSMVELHFQYFSTLELVENLPEL